MTTKNAQENTENTETTEITEITDENAFSSAFDEALGLAKPEAEDAPPGDGATTNTGVAAGGDAGGEGGEAGGEGGEAAHEKVDEEPAAAAPAPKETKPDPEPAAAETRQPAPEGDQPFFTEAEQAVVDEYTKEWKDHVEAQALIRRREYHALVSHIYDDISKALAPLQQYINAAQEVDHDQAVYGAHPDLDAIKKDMLAWVDTQPKMVKNAINTAFKEGDAEQVIEAIQLYKDAKGIKAAEAPAATVVDNAGTTAQNAVSGKGASSKAKEAAHRLSAVGTKRSAVGSSAADKDDFSGAFKEATSGQ